MREQFGRPNARGITKEAIQLPYLCRTRVKRGLRISYIQHSIYHPAANTIALLGYCLCVKILLIVARVLTL
jgi:hypothetical protein